MVRKIESKEQNRMVSLECVAAQYETSAAPGTNDQSGREAVISCRCEETSDKQIC
jgi:hypothetical protein